MKVRLRTGITASYLTNGGSGTPMVLVHAWVESARSFDRLMPMLPATVCAYAVDLRGHGDSDKPAYGYSLAEVAEDVVAFLDAMGIERATLLGSSSGGYVTQQVAAVHPDRVDGLILVGSPRSLHGRPSFADEVERLTDPVDRAYVEESLRWYALATEVDETYLRDRVEDGLRVPAAVWRLAMNGLFQAIPPTEVAVITAPTLVIRGGADELLPAADTEALVAAIPGATLTVYDGVGHLVLWERPDRIAEDVARRMEG